MLESLKEVINLKIILLISTFLLIYLYLKKVVYSYWKSHGVPHDEPKLFIGTLKKEFFQKKITLGMEVQQSYDKYKSYPFHGIYMFLTPILMINDAELIKDVLIKNFQCFPDRGVYYNTKNDFVTGNLFHLPGERWKVMRAKLNSVFTPNKVKKMFPHLHEVADEVINVSNEKLLNSDIIEVRDIISRYIIDAICSLFFGFNPNSLHDPNSAFHYYGLMALETHPVTNALTYCAPEILDFFRMTLYNKQASHFFINLFPDMINKRRSEEEKRNDFLDLMIELLDNTQEIKEDSSNKYILDNNIKELASKPFTVIEATANAFTFFIAGMESSSSTITYCLYELSENPGIQQKLHREIDEFLQSSNELNMENLMKLEYLDMVLNETLRKHPPVPFLNRICVKDYKIPNSNYCIPKGMRILITVYGIHRDPDIYPDPEKFDPTRFDKTNSAARHPCHFIPFGEGPRHCIGQRLAILQSKLIIFTLLSKYQFSVFEKTEKLEYSRESLIHSPRHKIYLRIQRKEEIN